jgi:two-component system chemotaxis sensor kinase CheA
MNSPAADDELILDYLAECREHLATIETDLLAIEQGGAEIDEQLVNRVFRAAHSIKGGAGFFGLTKIQEVAHKTENALDLIRSREMIPTPEIVSVLLLAFDKLHDLIDNYRDSNEADVWEFITSLTALTRDNLPADLKASLAEHVSLAVPESNRLIEISAFDLSQASKGGKCLYLLQYDLIHDIQRRNKTPLEVFKKLINCGTIIHAALDVESAGTLEEEPRNELLLEVLYATVLEPDLIGDLVDVPLDRIRLIQKNGSERPLAEKLPAGEIDGAVSATDSSPLAQLTLGPPSVGNSDTPAGPPDLARAAAIAPQAPPTTASKGPAKAAPLAPPALALPSSQGETTIRLNVSVLDSLMTLAGELVLSRNQLNESLSHKNERGIRSSAQRISLVTSELQEVVTLTRMQPVGSLFSKATRLVRDLARDLGKEAQLKISGGEVEIDKTILEGLSDPLTHMVRNAVDHGLELPADRVAAGKPATGTVTLSAAHQAGQVVIEISDDGPGLSAEKIAASSLAKGLITRERLQTMSDRDKMALIFQPGVSTAAKVSDVSGRGVGMDVVKTNLDRLGGKIEIDSAPGKGTRFRIKLPLTLAIIPSLLISNAGERFAIPQANVGELIRIPASQIAQRTDRVGGAEVLILRDRLVPLLHLADALEVPRHDDPARPLNVALVDTGVFEYGLVVDDLHDTVEIVVKPLGRHLKGLTDYAGATILGDGRVAVILDVAGLAARGELLSGRVEGDSRHATADTAIKGERHALLLFHNTPSEMCAVPVEQISRIESVRPAQIEYVGGRRTMQYRGASLPVVTLQDTASVGQLSEDQQWVVLVIETMRRPLGLLAARPLDIAETTLEIDTLTLRQRGVAGSAVYKERTVLVLDIVELAQTARPDLVTVEAPAAANLHVGDHQPTVLLAEDSDFFRAQLQRLIEGVGCRVLAAEDGQAAWEVLDRHSGEVDVVATDVEMPRLDGLSLARQIRADGRFVGLPIIAISSLAGEEEIARGLDAGVDEYQVKLNKDQLQESILRAVSRSKASYVRP